MCAYVTIPLVVYIIPNDKLIPTSYEKDDEMEIYPMIYKMSLFKNI